MRQTDESILEIECMGLSVWNGPTLIEVWAESVSGVYRQSPDLHDWSGIHGRVRHARTLGTAAV